MDVMVGGGHRCHTPIFSQVSLGAASSLTSPSEPCRESVPWAPDPASHSCCRCLTPEGHALSSGGGRGRAGGQRLWEAAGGAGGPGHWARHTRRVLLGFGAGHGGPEQSPASWVSSRGEPSSLEPRWFPEDGGTGAGCCLFLAGSRGQLWRLPRPNQGTTHPD